MNLVERKGARTLEQEFQVQIQSSEELKKVQLEKISKGQLQFKKSKQNKILFQWSYKVFKGDSNYTQRTDIENDFIDLDPDQNTQIENFYNQCLRKNDFTEKLDITGDLNGVKNGFQY